MYQRIKDFLSGQRGGDGHVDRSVIVVYPKAPYVKWTGEDLKANGLYPEKDGTAYLDSRFHGNDEVVKPSSRY